MQTTGAQRDAKYLVGYRLVSVWFPFGYRLVIRLEGSPVN